MDKIQKLIDHITYKPFIDSLSEKYVNDAIINENDIDLLFPTRVFADTSTSAYTSVFLADNLIIFVDYLFTKLFTDIHINLNKKLVKKDFSILIENEDIVLVFKGGNVMHFYFNNIEKKSEDIVYTNLDKNSEEIEYISFIKDISAKNFSISDVDFSIYIKAGNIKRYNEIYGTLLEILYSSCNDISKFFDSYYKAAVADDTIDLMSNSFDLLPTKLFNEEKIDMVLEKLNLIVSKIHYIKKYKFVNRYTLSMCTNLAEVKYIDFDKVNTTRKSYIKEMCLLNISSLISEIINQEIEISECYDVISLAKILRYCSLIIYITKKVDKIKLVEKVDSMEVDLSSISHLKKSIRNKMTKISNTKLNTLINSNFYTKEKIKMYIKILEEKLNQLRKNSCHFSKNDTEVKIMSLKDKIITTSDIAISKKNNFKLILDKTQVDDTERIHYISFNRSIHTIFSNYDLNFDLLRIKFNTVMNNNFVINKYSAEKNHTEKHHAPIPSEFLDISIPCYSDYYRQHYVDDMSYKILHGIPSYTIKQIYEDLIFVLYKQSNFVPWADKKYEKRIGRSIIFGLLSDSNNFVDLLKLIQLVYDNIVTKSQSFQTVAKYIDDIKFIYGYSDEKRIKNLVYNEYNGSIVSYNSLLINKKYENIEDYLRNIIYFFSLHNSSTEDYIKFVNNIRKLYNRSFIDFNTELFVEEYKTNFIELLRIMHKYISVFSKILS